jgi:hypothetical protein
MFLFCSTLTNSVLLRTRSLSWKKSKKICVNFILSAFSCRICVDLNYNIIDVVMMYIYNFGYYNGIILVYIYIVLLMAEIISSKINYRSKILQAENILQVENITGRLGGLNYRLHIKIPHLATTALLKSALKGPPTKALLCKSAAKD